MRYSISVRTVDQVFPIEAATFSPYSTVNFRTFSAILFISRFRPSRGLLNVSMMSSTVMDDDDWVEELLEIGTGCGGREDEDGVSEDESLFRFLFLFGSAGGLLSDISSENQFQLIFFFEKMVKLKRNDKKMKNEATN